MNELARIQSKVSLCILCLGLGTAGFAAATELNVPRDYATIQGAVNAAQTNDIIIIAPGVYAEQVQILSKKLTVLGQPGAILRATEQLSSSPWSTSGHVPIMAILTADVTVRGLTFEGERLAGHFAGPGVGDLVGLYFLRSSGDVENCAFYGFRDRVPGSEGAGSLWFQTFADDDVNARVVSCTFADDYEGIYLRGSPTRQSIRATVENNTIVGLGPLTNDLNYSGIFIREGVGGRIAGNTISGFSYIGTKADFPISFGILGANEANYPAFGTMQLLLIEDNVLRDNQAHIVLIQGDGSVIRNNHFQGTALGIVPVGVGITGTNVTIADNQFEEMKEGIRLMGNDPIFGTILGRAINGQVISNLFCGVAVPVTVQSLANATVVGTASVCPLPPPQLVISPAVILSWLGQGGDWIVQSAPTVDGPWTTSDATPFMQSGRHTIAEPVKGERRVFRLRRQSY